MRQQFVRITALTKTLDSCEKAAYSMIQSGVVSFKTPEEIEAFKKGVQITLALIRGEYGIKAE